MAGSVKERLTGALIFVAAVVVIVPEMFSGPQPRPAATAPTQAEEESALPLRTYSMTLTDSAEARAPAPLPAREMSHPEVTAAQQPPAAPLPAEHSSAAAVNPDLSAPEPTTATSAGSWWLQVGIFSSRDNAQRLVHKLQAAGFAVEMNKYLAAGKEMFRVRAGPVADRAEALALQGRLAASGNNSLLLPP